MADETGVYHVYKLSPCVADAPHLLITTLYRTQPDGRNPGGDRAEWFVVIGAEPWLVTAQTAGYSTALASPIQISDATLHDIALEEATLAAQQRQPNGDDQLTIKEQPNGKDLLIRYWIRGHCVKGVEQIREATRCPALRRDLDDVQHLHPLRRVNLLTGKPD